MDIDDLVQHITSYCQFVLVCGDNSYAYNSQPYVGDSNAVDILRWDRPTQSIDDSAVSGRHIFTLPR